MKKIFAALVAVFMVAIMFAPAASATRDIPSPENNKKVELCHYDGSNENGGSGKYSKIEVSINAFYTAGHIDHVNDIWKAFSWTDKDGVVHNVAAQGNTALLAFDKCEQPVVNEKVAKPEAVYNDLCGTEDDVFSVAPGRGYTVGAVVVTGNTQSITATLESGFEWTDGTTAPVTITKPVFTDEPCDLPETGGVVTNAVGGVVILGLLAAGAVFLLRRRKTV